VPGARAAIIALITAEAHMKTTPDIESLILSAAKSRPDNSLYPLPKSVKLKPDELHTLIQSLMKRRIVELGRTDDPTKAWKTDRRGEHLMPILTIDVIKGMMTAKDIREAVRKRQEGRQATTTTKPTRHRATKLAILIDLLRRKSGASIKDMVKATKWKPHSIRGAMSGILKKKHRMRIEGTPDKHRGRVYRFVGKI